MLCDLLSVDKKHKCRPLLSRTIIKLTPQLLQSPQFNQDPSTRKTNITIHYFHLFYYKRRPGHIASWQLWACFFSPRQDWSRPSPIFSHCLFRVWVPGPQLELHIVHWDQADQAESEMWGKVFLSWPGQGLSISTISASGQGAPPWAEAVQARPQVLDISMSIVDTSLVRGWWKIKDGCSHIFTH